MIGLFDGWMVEWQWGLAGLQVRSARHPRLAGVTGGFPPTIQKSQHPTIRAHGVIR
jgi:hypothetical protein